ncbi:MAG: nucleotidyl transferase AbiEii/AbiGii toxin family protein [Elusimicrobiota bacterium]|jgi:predicted nucleotidyltransferase component of viral defense system|nr:nucleotidyl transferase AbiEii/AbiGii toxin family protein [Elusimicrobiota bacterium]
MNLFDKTVQAALKNNKDYSPLITVVEKEIMHHDILREMNKAGFLKNLTFIGGTCLRLCYGSERLSEDLDFTGGFDFRKKDLSGIGDILQETFRKKYDFKLDIMEPVKETGNTETWKIKIITRPKQPDLPAQRINIDISILPSYERKPAMLKNYYGIEQGTSGLILFAESLNEIFVDKIIAFALRPNRVKNRDLWDIFWLSRKNIELSKHLLDKKLNDRKIAYKIFSVKYAERLEEIKNGQSGFIKEMRRFLAPSAFDEGFTNHLWWQYLLGLLEDFKL